MSQLALNIEGGRAEDARDGTNSVSVRVQGLQYSVDQIQDVKGIRKLVNSCDGKPAQFLLLMKIVIDPRGLFGDFFWKTFFGMVNGESLLYFVIYDDEKCLGLDNKLGMGTIIVASSLDLFTSAYVLYRLGIDLCSYARKYRSWFDFAFGIVILVFLGLPLQLVLLVSAVSQRMIGTNYMFMFYLVLAQYLLRTIIMLPFSEYAEVVAGEGSHYPLILYWTCVTFVLSYFGFAGVFGASRHVFSIRSVNECWKKACINHTGSECGHSFYCDGKLANYTFLNDFCSIKTPNTTFYDFGMFLDALQSGFVEASTDISDRLSYSLGWGMQTLSALGQGLQAKTKSENHFVCFITYLSVLFLIFLVGIFQVYIQHGIKGLHKKRLKKHEIKQWPHSQKLSEVLQKQIKKNQPYKWQGTEDVNVENFLNNFSDDLKRDIKRELCLGMLKKVEAFRNWNATILDELCNCVKPAFFVERAHILRERDPIDEMLFVLEGNLWTYTTRDITSTASSSTDSRNSDQKDFLKDGDFFGEELVAWGARDDPYSSNLPISKRNVKALTNVEAFVITAYDLKKVFINKRNQELGLDNHPSDSSQRQQELM